MATVFTELIQFQDVVDILEENFPESDVLDTERGRFWYQEWDCKNCGKTHGKYILGFPSRKASIGMKIMSTAVIEPAFIRDVADDAGAICTSMKENMEEITHKALIQRSAPWN